jgi:hypothetical protein
VGTTVEVVVVVVEVVVVEDVVDCSGMVGSTGNDVVVGAEEVVDSATVVVDTSVVVVDSSVVVVDSSVVVVDTVGLVVNASSGTISQLPLSIFQANIRHAPPPFSYAKSSSGTLAA